MLDVADTLVAVDATAWISSPAFVARADELVEIGSGPTVNLEILLDLDPDLIMTYGQGNEWDTFPKLEEVNLPYVINAEWTESTPLARAEWVKFVSLFYNREAEANRQFEAIVSEYESLSARAAAVSEKPTVLLDAPFQGTWWVAGGGSFAAQLLEDAGAEYVWADNESTGSLMLDIESVFEEAGNADYWLNTGSWNSLDDARKADERFTEFAAFENEQVYNNNRRMGPGGGNEYFETGPAYPHRVLADLIHIFHPEILPDHELYYYQKLD
jgi:iron complex transport system substrate-binding protein